jgi:hypothetical protein
MNITQKYGTAESSAFFIFILLDLLSHYIPLTGQVSLFTSKHLIPTAGDYVAAKRAYVLITAKNCVLGYVIFCRDYHKSDYEHLK